ncbi:hypothetical protein G9A89_017101 [Geosiphon pyriformis]|nr:hypothetical protein G9A89_017101 [Geosiphon pyriformis]
MPLNYMDDSAFSSVIVDIGMEELSLVVDNLLNNKAAGLSGIPNELWKHCNREVLVCLLKLLNLCLSVGCSEEKQRVLVSAAGYVIITNFGLLDGYKVHDKLDQEEIFSPLLWTIFYDLLLCEVKRQEHLCGYRINSRFVAKSGRIEVSGEKTSFLAVGAFVDDTIWVRSSQAFTQYILNIASEFFVINNISINNNKTVVISINQRSLSKSSLAQAHKDFSFVILDVCHKWDIMIRKDLRTKTGLLRDFLSEVLYHSYLYGLKPFEQSPLNPLQFPVKLYVSSVNNFLARVVKIFLENELSLANNLPCVFHGLNDFPMSGILGQFLYYKSVFSLKCFGVAFSNRIFDKKGKQLDPRGPVPYWFSLASDFINNYISLGVKATTTTTKEDVLSVLDSDRLSEVYIDEFLRCAGSVETADEAAAYFPAADTGIRIKVTGLLFSTLAKLQAVMLALECVLSSCSVVLYLDSQFAINACISETSLTTPDFHNQYKNISIKWVKVKGHSDVLDNIRADTLANEATSLFLSLLVNIWKRFLVTEKTAISDLHWSICCACWKTGLSFDIVPNVMIKEID